MWKYVNVSVKGTSHEATNIPCQDNNSCLVLISDDYQTLIAIVSDGAGSATKSEIGSKFICQKFVRDIKKSFEDELLVKDFTQDFFKDWINNFQEELQKQAEAEKLLLKDYACTFLAVIIGENSACFAQIGDGAIVFKNEENEYNFMFLPQQGEYVNQTFFATDKNARTQLQFDYLEKQIDELAIFTDGIQNLVIDFQTLTVNDEFFSQWFEWLREIQDRDVGNLALESYLNSPKINERTDDDKTFLLAVRKNEPTKQVEIIKSE